MKVKMEEHLSIISISKFLTKIKPNYIGMLSNSQDTYYLNSN